MNASETLNNQLKTTHWKSPLANYSCALRPTAVMMVTSIDGFSNLVSHDYTAGMLLLAKSIKLQEYYFNLYQCTRVVKMGDMVLAGFSSPEKAVECALKISRAASKMFNHSLKIGLHLGEVRYVEDDFFGTQINAVLDIQKEAKPDQVLISELLAKSINVSAFELGLVKTDRHQPFSIFEIKHAAAAGWSGNSFERYLSGPPTDTERAVWMASGV